MYTFIYKILVNAAFVSHRYSEAVHLLYVAMLRCEILSAPLFMPIYGRCLLNTLEAEPQLTDLAHRNTKTRRVFWILHWYLRLNVSLYFVSNFFWCKRCPQHRKAALGGSKSFSRRADPSQIYVHLWDGQYSNEAWSSVSTSFGD